MKTIYLCGPTLYSDIHIGNARSLVFFDVVSEYFRRTEGVKYVRNITDIDDKIFARCGKQKPWKWVDVNTLPQYRSDCNFLGLKSPDLEPRASDHMDDVWIASKEIGEIQDKDYVLDTSKVENYGILSGRKPEGKFTLWKGEDKPHLKGGHPGWHGECQAMIHYIFGDEGVDIHGGGTDLKFPHHENERAIHKCLTGKEIAKEWLYVGTVLVDNKKMAKSLGNFITIKELSEDWDTGTIRTCLLMTNHSKPINFSFNRMSEAEKLFNKNNEHAFLTDLEWSDRQFQLVGDNYKTRL